MIRHPIETYIVPAQSERKRMSDLPAGTFKTIASRKAFKNAIKTGNVSLNGNRAFTGDYASRGDLIEIFQDPETNRKPSIAVALEVLYEDDFLAVVYKPAGIIVSGNKKFTLENSLRFNLTKSTKKDALLRPEPIHRLDYPTSGCLLVGKTSEAVRALNAMFEAKTIQKTYHAITVGTISEGGEIRLPIESKESVTVFKRIDQLESKKYNYLNLVELTPQTGRKHQLRIHLSNLGSAIFGDKTYGKSGKAGHGSGLYLHATSLRFIHPVTSEEVYVATSLPKKFTKLFPKLKV